MDLKFLEFEQPIAELEAKIEELRFVGDDSEININEYLFDPGEPANNTSQISVLAGTLRYVSGKIAKDDPENVSFTAGESTIGVRGTYISISVCPEGEECD